jgi:general secretion pathway protein B
MSYILDALRKAERDRRLGGIPGIDLSSLPARHGTGSRWPLWLALGLLINAILLAGALAIWHNTRPVAEDVVQSSGPATPAAQTRAVVPPAGAARRTDPAAAPKPPPEPVADSLTTRAPESAAVPAVKSPAAPTPVKSRPLPPAPALSELAESFRQSLPTLDLTVHVYSESASQRFVFVNGQRYREGQQITGGPLLESIQPRGVVMRWKGQRFQLLGDW